MFHKEMSHNGRSASPPTSRIARLAYLAATDSGGGLSNRLNNAGRMQLRLASRISYDEHRGNASKFSCRNLSFVMCGRVAAEKAVAFAEQFVPETAISICGLVDAAVLQFRHDKIDKIA
jgi:hypothetical protein